VSGGDFFEIDTDSLERVGGELGATARQVGLALARALTRTAATLRRKSERGLRTELELRALKFLRLRLKSLRMKRTRGWQGGDVSIWYGLNPMPVGEFKGKPMRNDAGASFRGTQFPGGFVGRNKRRQPTVFKRRGGGRLPIEEQTLEVQDRMQVFLEDRIFQDVENIFWEHFKKDLAARVKYKLGEQ
jgi:hypothetical protein